MVTLVANDRAAMADRTSGRLLNAVGEAATTVIGRQGAPY
jgi:hypothetical protein